MLGKSVLSALFLLAFASPASSSPVRAGVTTVFQHAEGAWAVGTIRLGKAMPFRDGRVVVFISQVDPLLWAPDGTKPRNMMLVHDVFSSDGDKPFFQEGDVFVAPIRLLPDHSYWKDNLPNTPKHQVAGGRRYVFRGDDMEEANRILGRYFQAHETNGLERWKGQLAAVASALLSSSSVLREDAVAYIEGYTVPARDFGEEALGSVREFLKRDELPVEQKATVVLSLARGGVTALKPTLVELASRADALGAVALEGLEALGEVTETARAVELSRSSSVEVRSWAAGSLGRRGGSDEAAFARAAEILANPGEDPAVRAAAAGGIGASGNPRAAGLLVSAVDRGDAASRPAAEAIAAAGLTGTSTALGEVLAKRDGEAATAAVLALGRLPSCGQCAAILHEQHESHRDESVRRIIGLILELPREHQH